MASLRAKPVILEWKSDLTVRHLKLPNRVIWTIYFHSSAHPQKSVLNQTSASHPTRDQDQESVFCNCFQQTNSEQYLVNEMHKPTVAPGKSGKFLTNCPPKSSLLLSTSPFLFLKSEQVVVITCNRLWRGYRTFLTSLAIKSREKSSAFKDLMCVLFSWEPF